MIEIKDISKHYGEKKALDHVNVTISEGVCFGLVGPNGAGKSTLMKILSTILLDYKGEATFDGKAIRSHTEYVKNNIGYIPQDIVLNETLSAKDNLLYFGRIYGLTGKILHDKVAEILRLVGLTDRAKDAVKTFSGGMKRRINIGCALMHSPKFIIMDEPTVGVDPQSRSYIFDIIDDLKKQGSTILYSSHYMEEIENHCDEMAIIDHGRVLEYGKVHHILKKYSTPTIYVEADGLQEEMLQHIGKPQHKNSGFLIEVDTPITALNDISQLLTHHGFTVSRLEISSRTLEDIFLTLTGKNLRD